MRRLKLIYSSYADVDPNGRLMHEDLDCDAVLLSNWTTLDNTTDTSKAGAARGVDPGGLEIYWGFREVGVHPLYAGETTDYIFVDNLADIFARANKTNVGTVRVSFSCFIFVDYKEPNQ